ncbi:MAG: Uma2 family endonuclease [Sporichthyaceae bacterium]|nr:Uma2 family endonuclease [Sporichthyaceae bacterium]
MSVMTAPALPPDYGRPFTVADLEDFPDDGHRYELLDGNLIVTPAPAWSHQEVALSLAVLLRQACPADLRVVIAPFAVQLADDTELQPDVLVARYDDLTPKNLPTAPVLAIEVASPSTRLIDRNLKLAAFERFGAASFWLVDASSSDPMVTVFDLVDGKYEQLAEITGDQELTVTRPFPIRLRPSDLVAGLLPRDG